MKTSIIYWGIICFIFLSCSQSSSKKDVTEIVITNSVPELSLTHDSLTAINEIGIGDIAVADTFLMILQPDKEDILNVYSLPTHSDLQVHARKWEEAPTKLYILLLSHNLLKRKVRSAQSCVPIKSLQPY